MMMVEAHQPIDVLERLPVHRLCELAQGVQAMVIQKNAMVLAATPPTAP